MKRLMIRLLLTVTAVVACQQTATPTAEASAPPKAVAAEPKLLNHVVANVKGEKKALADYRGKVLLVVNTASECGFTPQYGPLQKLYERYKAQGFEVLAFPSNDFGSQEPLSEPEVEKFCTTQYGVTFPLFAKVHAKGADISPVYRTLTETTGEGIRGDVRWNFTKFLVSRDGRVVSRFEPVVDPLNAKLVGELEALLKEPAPK